MTTSVLGVALHRTMLSEGVVDGYRRKIRRDGVLDEGMDPGGWYICSDTLRPQPYGRTDRCTVPTSGTPSLPRGTTMITSAQGGALDITMLLEGVVGGCRGKIRERWCG